MRTCSRKPIRTEVMLALKEVIEQTLVDEKPTVAFGISSISKTCSFPHICIEKRREVPDKTFSTNLKIRRLYLIIKVYSKDKNDMNGDGFLQKIRVCIKNFALKYRKNWSLHDFTQDQVNNRDEYILYTCTDGDGVVHEYLPNFIVHNASRTYADPKATAFDKGIVVINTDLEVTYE